jgi:divalent metal cation (Fe/Co/Zn/Cd) transporter
VLVVQTDFLQSLMAGLGDDSAVWGGLHALDGFLAIAVAAYLYGRALGLSRGNRGRAKS